MKKYQYYIADVFTNKPFNGAQIAVLPQADGLSQEAMALIAKELNLTETVFILHDSDTPSTRRMKVFSPFGEIDFAGHPIIAAAFVLAHCNDIELNSTVTPVIFNQNSGPLTANISALEGKPTFVQFTRSISSIIDHFAPSDAELASIFGFEQSELDHKKYAPRLVSCGFPYLIVPVWNYNSVRKAKFNYSAWSQSIAPQTAAQEIVLFAPKSPYPDADFNLRLFGPNIGIKQDPPVGNAVPAFCAYLCSFEHTQLGTHTFSIDRGDDITRRSVLNVEMDHKGKTLLTVRVGGEAVLFAEGTINV